jgi:citrate synthase
VLVLVLLAISSNFYSGMQLARNSDELASLRQLLAKSVMGSAIGEAEELQKRMDALNQSATGIDAMMKRAQNEMDANLKKAQDDLVARMNVELPKMMDNYIKQRAPVMEKQVIQHGLAVAKP